MPGLPGALQVPTAEGEVVSAAAGTGPAGLASTAWELTRKGDGYSPYGGAAADTDSPEGYGGLLRGEPLVRPPEGGVVFVVHFGEGGEMVKVTENKYFLAEIYGNEVPVGGGWVETPLPALMFRSQSYGLHEEDHYAVAARFQVRFVGLLVAHATVYSYGDVVGDSADGTFGYELDFRDGLLSFAGAIEDDYPVKAERLGAGGN